MPANSSLQRLAGLRFRSTTRRATCWFSNSRAARSSSPRLLEAAREQHLALDSYLACERLYVDELMGGRLNRFFSTVLEHVAPDAETRGAVVRFLCEAVA